MAIDNAQALKTLEDIKQRALSIQSSLGTMKQADISTPDPAIKGFQDNIAKNLNSALGSMGSFDSQQQTILQKYNERRSLAEKAAAEERGAIKSSYDADIEVEQEEGARALETSREASRNLGQASMRALIIQEEEKTNKRVKNLTRTRDELLAQNRANEASRIDGLIAKEEETMTNARQNYLTNLFNLAREGREQASFETPDQKRQKDYAMEQKKQTDALKTQFADIKGVAEATDFPSIIKLIAPVIGTQRAAQIASQKLDDDLKRAQIAYTNAQRQKALNDISGNGVLTEADLTKIDKSPQGQKLNSLAGLTTAASRYKTLLDQYGTEFRGVGKTLLEGAYADLQVKWKEAANLGALTGPDLDLIMDAVKPATGFRGLGTAIFGGGAAGIKASVDQLLATTRSEAEREYTQLLTRNPAYAKSEYVQGLALPFQNINPNPPKPGAQTKSLNSGSSISASGVDPNNMFFNFLNNGK